MFFNGWCVIYDHGYHKRLKDTDYSGTCEVCAPCWFCFSLSSFCRVSENTDHSGYLGIAVRVRRAYGCFSREHSKHLCERSRDALNRSLSRGLTKAVVWLPICLWLSLPPSCTSSFHAPFPEGLLQLLVIPTPRRTLLVIIQHQTFLQRQMHFERHSPGSGDGAQGQCACQTFIRLWASPQVLVFYLRKNSNCNMTFRDSWGYFIAIVICYVSLCLSVYMHFCVFAYSRVCGDRRPLVLSTLLADWDRISQWTWSSWFPQGPGNWLSLTPGAGVTECAPVVGFYLSTRSMNSGPHACTMIALRTELSLQPFNY